VKAKIKWDELSGAFIIFIIGVMFGYAWCWQALLGGR